MMGNYHITGMTCNGCRSAVEKALSQHERITSVSVDLEKKLAIIHMTEEIAIADFREILAPKYGITKLDQNIKMDTEKVKNEWRQLRPLGLIFLYITVAALLLNPDAWQGFMFDFMGLFYLVFSFFKILDFQGFPKSFAMYDPLAKKIPMYGWIYPFIETVLAVLFLMRVELGLALGATLVILGITTIGVIQVLMDKRKIQCACLGTALKLPMTKATLIENTIMLAMAIGMLIKMYL